jgi:hypothetical protein
LRTAREIDTERAAQGHPRRFRTTGSTDT